MQLPSIKINHILTRGENEILSKAAITVQILIKINMY
jgi:hypothetical protein